MVALVAQARSEPSTFQGTQAPVPATVAERMRGRSWREGCPVPIADLAYLRLSYWGRDGAGHEGELIVHRDLAADVLAVFKTLFDQKFPVEKMQLVDAYDGDDDRSMAANNTSAFNCRSVAGKPGVLSKHAYGRAIDVNPLWNPMVSRDGILPPAGAAFANRAKPAPGILRADDPATRAFKNRGFAWGGDWTSMKDYQHFQK